MSFLAAHGVNGYLPHRKRRHPHQHKGSGSQRVRRNYHQESPDLLAAAGGYPCRAQEPSAINVRRCEPIRMYLTIAQVTLLTLYLQNVKHLIDKALALQKFATNIKYSMSPDIHTYLSRSIVDMKN